MIRNVITIVTVAFFSLNLVGCIAAVPAIVGAGTTAYGNNKMKARPYTVEIATDAEDGHVYNAYVLAAQKSNADDTHVDEEAGEAIAHFVEKEMQTVLTISKVSGSRLIKIRSKATSAKPFEVGDPLKEIPLTIVEDMRENIGPTLAIVSTSRDSI